MKQLLLKGNPIGLVNGVLFDKDGTLSNSEEHLIYLAKLRIKETKRFLEERSSANIKEGFEIEKLLSSAYGITNNRLLKPDGILAVASRLDNLKSTATVLCLLGEAWPSALEFANKIFTKVDSEYANKQTPSKRKQNLLPGVKNFLKTLKKAEITCALISNDTKSGIEEFLNINDLEDTFLHFWSADDQPSKPDPNAVKELCNLIELPPAQCALIGDADTDLKMAYQAGIGITVGYLAGWTHTPHLRECNQLIHHWDELTVQGNLK